MARRKQTKQTAESVAIADANGDVTPPKRRKIAATVIKEISEDPIQPRTRLRRAKTEKNEDNEDQVINDASPPKRPRVSKTKNAPAPPKIITKSKSNKTKKIEEAMQNNDAAEQISAEQVVKRTRTKTVTVPKKAGTKVQVATKVKSKAPSSKKQKNDMTVETVPESNAASENTKQIPAKKTRAKPIEKKDVMLATRTITTRALRKRKNTENTDNSNNTEAADAQITEQKKVADKKPRIRVKKTDDEPKVISKGKAKKTTAKAEIVKLSLKESEIEEQNDYNIIVQEDNNSKKAKNTKKTQKKTNPQGKQDASVEKINGIEAETAVMSEEEIKEDEELETKQAKQKKKNTGKANEITEKTEGKGKQKKGQTATKPVVEKETENSIEKDDITEEVNATSEALIENSTKVVLLSKNGNTVKNKEDKDKVNKNESSESMRIMESINNELLKGEISTEEEN